MKKIIIVTAIISLCGIAYSDEHFCCASDYTIHNETESKIIPGIIVDTQDMFICPADKNIIIPLPEHGEKFRCGGHTFVIHGNGITIID